MYIVTYNLCMNYDSGISRDVYYTAFKIRSKVSIQWTHKQCNIQEQEISIARPNHESESIFVPEFQQTFFPSHHLKYQCKSQTHDKYHKCLHLNYRQHIMVKINLTKGVEESKFSGCGPCLKPVKVRRPTCHIHVPVFQVICLWCVKSHDHSALQLSQIQH